MKRNYALAALAILISACGSACTPQPAPRPPWEIVIHPHPSTTTTAAPGRL